MKNVRLMGVLLAIGISFSLATANMAAALTIIETSSFNVTSNPTGVDFLGVDPFDPSLGTLDRVAVAISGVMAVQALAPPNFSPPPSPIPIPYPLLVRVEQTFFGLGEKFFTFETPGQFLFTGVALGVGEFISFQRPFSYNFTFNNLTDIIGFVLPGTEGVNIPPIISGQRSDFGADLSRLNEIDLIQQVFGFSFGGPTLQGLQATANGALIIQYDYTPVPLPGTVWLWGSGLLGLMAWRRWGR